MEELGDAMVLFRVELVLCPYRRNLTVSDRSPNPAPCRLTANPSHCVKHISGDMFESIPNGDAIFLKLMLHLHNDEECIKILKNCHQALPNNGKVIAVEIVLPTTPEPIPAAQNPLRMDMIMLNLLRGGKERTEQELAKLARDSGFCGAFRTTYIAINHWALEFCK
uniref:O-methyltransferase C-terminal domain-containing protein n=1 Tax=Oryza brachyantha TaxID=4533 RepID=J3LVQ1_ORYBR